MWPHNLRGSRLNTPAQINTNQNIRTVKRVKRTRTYRNIDTNYIAVFQASIIGNSMHHYVVHRRTDGFWKSLKTQRRRVRAIANN